MNPEVVAPGLEDELRALFGRRVRRNEPLAKHTSFRIGGPADYWVEIQEPREIAAVQECALRYGVPWTLLGGGTNVLVSDLGVRGIVIRLGRRFAFIHWQPKGEAVSVRAGASLPLKKLVLETVERDLSGLEFAEGIPGTVGGGLLMNAGAFGGELADVVRAVELVSPEGQELRVPKKQLRFGYRWFDLPRGTVVTAVEFELRHAPSEHIQRRYQMAKERRDRNQPKGLPNAGSVFKNPPQDFAGRLIEAVGLKGHQVGQAMISSKHANFIVNLGGAKAAEVRQLMREAQRRVAERFGVQLEPEIRLMGEWRE
ncbi:MAG: UDP-N-acetylmuramate dehydrogenase [Candidatus Binatia bacterium]|nr:UDP-N-acetylmuramate dehydrogenase [Candidatus Binatia bacterium]